MVDFNREKLLQQAAAEISHGMLARAGASAAKIANQYNIDSDAADLVLAMAFLHVAAALSSAAYGVDESAAGKGFNEVITKLKNESRTP